MGAWGTTPMNTGASQVFIEGAHQSLFGSFLVIQKGTRPAGRNIPLDKKPPPQDSSYGGDRCIRKRIYTSFTTPTNRATPWLRSTNRKGRFRFITQVSSGTPPAPKPIIVTAAASTPSSFTLTRVICWTWFR